MTRFAGTQASSAHVASLVALYSPISHFALTLSAFVRSSNLMAIIGARVAPLCGQSPQTPPHKKEEPPQARSAS